MSKRKGSLGWAMSFRVGTAVFVALVTGLLASCVPLPAKAKVARTGDVQAPPGGIALSVLFSRDFSLETPKGLGDEMVECLTRGLGEAAPEVRLVPEEEFYRAVFGVKPGEVLLRADTIGTLLARPDIRQRVGESGLTHLILVGGATHHYGGSGGFGFVGGYGWGVLVGSTEKTRSTQLTASIFELASGQEGPVQSSAEGSQGIGMILPLVWGWVHTTESAACDALGAEVARAILGKPRDETR